MRRLFRPFVVDQNVDCVIVFIFHHFNVEHRSVSRCSRTIDRALWPRFFLMRTGFICPVSRLCSLLLLHVRIHNLPLQSGFVCTHLTTASAVICYALVLLSKHRCSRVVRLLLFTRHERNWSQVLECNKCHPLPDPVSTVIPGCAWQKWVKLCFSFSMQTKPNFDDQSKQLINWLIDWFVVDTVGQSSDHFSKFSNEIGLWIFGILADAKSLLAITNRLNVCRLYQTISIR